MASAQDEGRGEMKPQGKEVFSDEVVAQVKHAILFGGGYKRPPESTRFKKGQSGNPAGRPKKPDFGLGNSRSAHVLALREAERLIGVRDGEKVTQLPAIEAVLRAQYASGLRGNAYSLKHIVERYDWAYREERQHRLAQIEFWKSYKETESKAIADAKAKGETPPNPLPHPDDVIIDYETGVRFRGPMNEKELAQYEELLKLRDILIMQHELDKKLWTRDFSNDPLDGPGSAFIFADFINKHAPERFKLCETRIMMRLDRCGVTPKRVLLKQVYRAWRALLGHGVRRGAMMPPLRFAKQVMEQINKLRESDATSH
jgi:hypothetical protein